MKLLLIHLGFDLPFTNWVMGCLSSVSFVVFINGVVTPFFAVERGLNQGFPLSLLFFLLVAEGLSTTIKEAKT